MDSVLVALLLITVVVVLFLVFRPEVTLTVVGKVLAFLSLFILPVLAAVMGTSSHLERSKSTNFCLSCHEMQPYGKSLHIDNSEYIPASHFQNNRVPKQKACYTCHTDYTLFGDAKAKMRGLKHVYVHYLGTVPKEIKLYTPYNNRECLHCHAGARSFEQGSTHNEEEDRIKLLKANELSCMTCHSSVHDVAHLKDQKFWQEKNQ